MMRAAGWPPFSPMIRSIAIRVCSGTSAITVETAEIAMSDVAKIRPIAFIGVCHEEMNEIRGVVEVIYIYLHSEKCLADEAFLRSISLRPVLQRQTYQAAVRQWPSQPPGLPVSGLRTLPRGRFWSAPAE